MVQYKEIKQLLVSAKELVCAQTYEAALDVHLVLCRKENEGVAVTPAQERTCSCDCGLCSCVKLEPPRNSSKLIF